MSDDSLRVFEIAASLFLGAELNHWFRELMNPLTIFAKVLSQKMITKQVAIAARFLRQAQEILRRGLQEYETWTGSEVEIGLEASFENEPAPHTDEVNDAQAAIWLCCSEYFISNLTAILAFCGSELSDISETEFNHAKETIREDYVNGELVNETSVNITVDARLTNMSM